MASEFRGDRPGKVSICNGHPSRPSNASAAATHDTLLSLPPLSRVRASGSMEQLSFEKVDEVADGLDPLDHIIGNFHPKLIFDGDHQFETIKPVQPEIFTQKCFTRDIFGVYANTLRNEVAKLDSDVRVYGTCVRYDGIGPHGPISDTLPTSVEIGARKCCVSNDLRD